MTKKTEEPIASVTKKSILSMIGLSMRQGAVGSGEFLTEKTVKEGKAYLVIVAEDASDNTKKMFRNMCTFYNTPLHIFGNKDELGHAIGKEFRASMALTNQGLSAIIAEKIEKLQANQDRIIQEDATEGNN